MKRLLCTMQFHKYGWRYHQDTSERYRVCHRCGKLSFGEGRGNYPPMAAGG